MLPINQKKQKYDSGYNAGQNQQYQAAVEQLEAAKNRAPVYSGQYGAETERLYAQLQNRQPFAYDINADALYQHYRDQYVKQGKLAMMDTMGQAQAMTGGYGSSYAQTAGQQAYNRYLGSLYDRLPQLYSQALARYQAEGSAMLQRYNLAKDLENQDYSRYRDQVADYQKELAQLQSNADKAYDRGYQSYMDGYAMQQNQLEVLKYLVEEQGYVPTWEELVAAGLTPEQAQRLIAQRSAQGASQGGSISGKIQTGSGKQHGARRERA